MTVIVADSAGLGHVIRCVALSEHLPYPVLYTPEPVPFAVPVETRTWDQLDNLVDTDLAIVDTYRKRDQLINSLRPKCRHLCAIVDDSAHSFQVDSLVSPHVNTETLAYHIPGKTYAGANYALVRPGIRRLRTRVARLLVCLGSGAPPPNLERDVRAAVLGTDIKVYVYGGPLDVMRSYPRVKPGYYSQLPDAMHSADLAITPASMTMLELLSCGVPCLTYAVNDHQRKLQHISPCAQYNSVTDIVMAINGDVKSMSQAALDLVDGRGCERVGVLLRFDG